MGAGDQSVNKTSPGMGGGRVEETVEKSTLV